MTGNGTRFKNAGYSKIKPFIKVHGKPIIEWVVKMFPGDEDKIIFVCQDHHIKSLKYFNSELLKVSPKSHIFSIKNWKKKGPIYDILLAKKIIDDESPVIISYCDYYMHWDYKKFKRAIVKKNCDGSIPCYKGFHPHLIPKKNLYATCKVDEKENLIEIKEKFSWHKNKTNDLHSPGLYYFKTGEILKKYCQEMVDSNDHINNEFYASLPFNYMVKNNLKVWCPDNVEFFCQWGTPEDLEEYLFWVNTIKNFKL